MYQSVYYDRLTYKTYIRDDSEGWSVYDYKPQIYKRVSNPTTDALPVLTGGYAIPFNKKFDKNDNSILEKDLNKEIAILRDLYYKEDETLPKWHNYVYIDIETEMGGKLTPEYIREAPMPITAIALIDVTTKTKICFIVDPSGEIEEIKEEGKLIIPCKTEKELILKFLDKWEELDATVVVGYNSEYFDIPYVYYRFQRIVGDEVLRLSPIKKINVNEENPEVLSIRIGGISHLDYMLLHKKYITKQEPSYKLKDIGLKYAKLEKIEYEGNLNQLFKRDKKTFIDYNLRDVEIIEGLEENLKFIELTILISHICNTPYESIYYNTILGEGAILKYLKKEGIVSPNKPVTTNSLINNIIVGDGIKHQRGTPPIEGIVKSIEDGFVKIETKSGDIKHRSLKTIRKNTSYAGGYLLDPEPGLYYDVIDLDFTSLYPSIIKSINIGIETLVGRIKVKDNYVQDHSLEKLKERNPEEEITIQKLNKETYKLSSAQIKLENLIKIIETNKYTISASGAIFDTEEQSVAAKILESWFLKREYYRGLKKEAGIKKEWDKFKLYDLFQHAFKILQNALYGTYAISSWRYTDGQMICSAAITNSGQRLTQTTIDYVNNELQKETKKDKKYIIISDTDSLYIELKDIIKYRFGEIKDIEEKNKKILEIANEIQTKSNSNLDNICINLFNIPKNKYFQLKQEVIASTILTTGKRRYGMFITNKEGVPIPSDHKDALDLKGLEVMKSNMNPLFKKFGEDFIKSILFNIPKSELDKKIIDFHKHIKTLEPKLIGKPSGVSYIEKCIKRKPKSGEMFSEFESNTKQNSKAAIIYNDLLKFKKLDKKFESIIEGDRVYIINLIKNPYHIDVIGFPNAKIPDEIMDFIITYIDRNEIFESMILKKLKELYSDLNWNFPSLNENVGKFFKFN